MKRVLLINPPYERFKYNLVGEYPIGLGFLATVLSEKGYDAYIYNAENTPSLTCESSGCYIWDRTRSQDNFAEYALDGKHPVWIEMRKCLENYQADLVGVYTTTVAYPIVLKIISLAKDINSSCITVLGGPHVTILPDKVMEVPFVDFILMGEAEYSLVDLCTELKNGTKDFHRIPGLGFRAFNKTYINKDYYFITDLAKLPIPNRKLILDRNAFPTWAIARIIMGSRGCPYNCTFCSSAHIWKRRIRYRPIDSIIEELKYLKTKFGISDFHFMDDTFTLHKERVKDFCNKLIQADLGLRWSCSSRADFINAKLLDQIKGAGCTGISVGVESGSNRILSLMKKHVTVEQIRVAAKLIRKKRFDFTALFVIGLPYETGEDIRKTINIMKEIKPDGVNVSTFFPYPGTEAHTEVVRQGLLPEDFDWANNLKFGHHSWHNRFNKHISAQQYESLMIEAIETARAINKPKLSKTARYYWRRKKQYMANPKDTMKKFCKKLWS